MSTARAAISSSPRLVSDALDAPGGAFRRRFLGVARHEAGQGDDTVVGSHADMGGVDAGLEFEFVEHVLPKL